MLFERAWLPAAPARLVVLVHGLAEHSGRYDAVGSWLARRGWAVHAWDQRGHGRSQGERTHVARFDAFLDDASAFLARVHARHPELARVVLGHSMGGLVVASLLEREPTAAAAGVLSAAALAPPRVRGRARLVGIVRHIAPRARLPIGIDPLELSRDPEVGRLYLEDPYVEPRMTASLAAELFRALSRVQQAGGPSGPPLLLLHGTADRICPAAGSQAFAARCGPRATLRLYRDLRHELLNEPEKEQILEEVCSWVRQLGLG